MDSATNLHRKAFDSCKLSVYIWLLGASPQTPTRAPPLETHCAHPDFKAWLHHWLKYVLKGRTAWQVVQDILPVKARSEVDRLLTELQDAQFKLEFEPTTTIEYVESLMLLDQIHERVSESVL